jgi:hypothetical protein
MTEVRRGQAPPPLAREEFKLQFMRSFVADSHKVLDLDEKFQQEVRNVAR